MKCEVARERMLAMLDAERDAVEAREFAQHLAQHLDGCAACRAHARAMRRLELALRASAAPELSDSDVALAARAVTRRVARKSVWPFVVAAAAAAALVAATLLWSRTPEATREDGAIALPGPGESGPRTPAPLPSPQEEPREPVAELAEDVAAVPDDAALQPVALDRELAAERELLRAALASRELSAFASRGEVLAFASELEADAAFAGAGTDAGLRRVEGLLRDADVAVRAARYVGVRGDRRSLGTLTRAAVPREELSLALLDLATASPDSLVLALAESTGRRRVLDRAAELALEPRALVDALAQARDVDDDAWRSVLTRAGAAELVHCVELVGRGGPSLASIASESARRADLGPAFAAAASVARGEHVDAWLDLLALAPRAEAVGWLVENLADRRRHDRALAALATLSGDEGLDELLREAARGRSRRADLCAVLRARGARDPRVLRTFAERTLQGRELAQAELLLDALIETESVDAAYALCAFALDASLAPELRLVALEALRERPSAAAATELAAGFERFTRRDRRLAAVLLLALKSHGDEAALDTALAEFDEAERRAIREVLERSAQTSATTIQLARLLEARLPEEARLHFDTRVS
ncbi:MAG: hypothetical protein IT453_21415 [Planctomycetes bacterium]|nr:hypothetical protein [Planctomycetota bacterium]